MADDLDDLREYHKNRRTGSKKVKIDGKTYTGGTKIKLKDGTTARMINVFGNPNDPMMHIIREDGSKQTMRLSNRVTGKAGRPPKETKQDAPKRVNPFIQVFNVKADKITKDTKDGKIKTLADLKQHPSYKSTFSGDVKNKLIGAFKAAGGDTSYTPVPKKEVKKKSAGSFAPEKLEKIKSGSFKAAGTSKGPDGTIQIQEKLLLDRKTIDAMSDAEYFRTFGKSRFSKAKGGIINANNGAFIEVQNRFSDRLLPGKKRTTRIY